MVTMARLLAVIALLSTSAVSGFAPQSSKPAFLSRTTTTTTTTTELEAAPTMVVY